MRSIGEQFQLGKDLKRASSKLTSSLGGTSEKSTHQKLWKKKGKLERKQGKVVASDHVAAKREPGIWEKASCKSNVVWRNLLLLIGGRAL